VLAPPVPRKRVAVYHRPGSFSERWIEITLDRNRRLEVGL
jgi:hypothetical protein